MQVKNIAGCSKGSILQYFRPSLSYHLPLSPLFCLNLSGRLRQILLYFEIFMCTQGFFVCSQVPKFGLFPNGIYRVIKFRINPDFRIKAD